MYKNATVKVSLGSLRDLASNAVLLKYIPDFASEIVKELVGDLIYVIHSDRSHTKVSLPHASHLLHRSLQMCSKTQKNIPLIRPSFYIRYAWYYSIP